MTDNVQYSEDGQYWWDGNQWQPVDAAGGGGQGGGGQDGGQGDAGQAAFSLGAYGVVAQLGVSDENDGPMPAANQDTKVSFTVFNVGTAAGTATVSITVDDQEVQTWTSGDVQPQGEDMPSDGFLHHCGSYPEGHHVFKATVSPASNDASAAASVTNEVDLS